MPSIPSPIKEQERRYEDLGDTNAEYADDDPRKYGYYNIGTTGYIGPRDHPYMAEERKPGWDIYLGDMAEGWEPYRPTAYGLVRVHNPEELSISYDPIAMVQTRRWHEELKLKAKKREKVVNVILGIFLFPIALVWQLWESTGNLFKKKGH